MFQGSVSKKISWRDFLHILYDRFRFHKERPKFFHKMETGLIGLL